MARAILFAEEYRGLLEDRRHIGIDEYVDIDMTIAVDPVQTEDSGSLTFTKPTYGVWARPRARFLDPHGHIVKKHDIEWLERTPRAYDASFICRVNQLRVVDAETGAKGFLVEVMSGIDSRQLLRAEAQERYTNWAKEHWWQISLALVVGWWWLF